MTLSDPAGQETVLMAQPRRRDTLWAKILLVGLVLLCFPVFWLLCAVSARDGGMQVCPGVVDRGGSQSWRYRIHPIAGDSPHLAARTVAAGDVPDPWRTLLAVGLLVVAALFHTLFFLMSMLSTTHLVATRASPDQRWRAHLAVNTWLDASYGLYIEPRVFPLRAQRAGETMQVHVRASREALITWSADSRYAVGWVQGLPLCAYDTVKGKQVDLCHNLLLFVPPTAAERSVLFDRLIAARGEPVEWLESAVPPGQESLRLEVVDKISDVTKPSKRGVIMLPLEAAVRTGDSKLIQAILERGADANQVSPGPAMTPLMISAAKGNVEAVRLLLARGLIPA